MSTEDDMARLAKRVEELEEANKVLWEWVRVLAQQDGAVLEIALHPEKDTREWKERKEKYAYAIIDNMMGAEAIRMYGKAVGPSDV